MVAEINGVASAELNLHCFYCHDPLGSTPEADHFILRIRYGIDAWKTWSWPAALQQRQARPAPGPAHVTAWASRNPHHDAALTGLATAAR